MKLNKKYLFLLLITLITIFSRAANVFNPYNYFFDPEQGIEYLITKSIVVDHKIVLIAHQGGFGSFSKGPAFNYLLAIPFIFTNGDPFGGRLMMLVISVFTVVIAFALFKRIFGLKTAILISFLLAVSPSLKDYSGAISPPFVIPLLTVFFIYFLYKSFMKELSYIPLLTLTVGLMSHFEMAALGILITLLILTGLICIIKKAVPYRYFFLSIGTFLLSIFPLLVFDVLNDFRNFKGVIEMISAGIKNVSENSFANLLNVINNRFEVFSWSYISSFSPNMIIYIFLLILLLSGITLILKDKKIKRYDKFFISFLTFIPIFTFSFLVVYPEVINQWWILYLTIIYCFLLGVVLNYFWKMNKLKLLVVMVILILSIAFLKRTTYIYKTQFIYSPKTYIKEDQAIKYIFANSKTKPFGIVILSARSQQNYQYLIWWNGQKYNYQPSRSPNGTYYAIIEPNITYTSEQVPGVLQEAKKLQNGFIIEKRIN